MSTWDAPDPLDLTAASGTVSVGLAPSDHALAVAAYSADASFAYFQTNAVVDGNYDTCWETSGAPGSQGYDTWIAIKDVAGPTTLTHYKLKERTYYTSRTPNEWWIDGSDDDGATWTTVDHQIAGQGFSWDGTLKTFTLAAPATFNWFRIRVGSTIQGDIVNLAEFYLNDLVPTGAANDTVLYYELTGLPDHRIYTLTFTDDTGVFYADWSHGWKVHNTTYPQGHAVMGSFNLYTPASCAFYSSGDRLILEVHLSTPGMVNLAWTSEDWEARPYKWYDAQEISMPDGTVTYDDLHGMVSGVGTPNEGNFGGERHFVFTNTSADPIAIQSNEPNVYYEIYRETGEYTYDDYIDDGYNLADGTPDPDGGNLAFFPEVGQTYHLVVYPEGSPTTTSTYQLTWHQRPEDPPPYFVANDAFDNAVDLGVMVDGLIQHYDNTGATEDSLSLPGARSVWYKFTVDAERALYAKATPSAVGDAWNAYIRFWRPDRTSFTTYGGGDMAMFVAPGQTYYLEVYFPDLKPFADWEQNGTLNFTLKQRPVDTYANAPYELIPGDTSPGGGQNAKMAPYLTAVNRNGYTYSVMDATRFWKITAPADGALTMIVETETTYIPQVFVTLPYDVGPDYNGQPKPVQLDASYSQGYYMQYYANHPRRLPVRQVGTTPANQEPLTITVKKGQVITIQANAYDYVAYFRWGFTTAIVDGTTTDWKSQAYGAIRTQDGSTPPYGLNQEQAGQINGMCVGWPNDGYGGSYNPIVVGRTGNNTQPHAVGFNGSGNEHNPPGSEGGIVTSDHMQQNFSDALGGRNGSLDATDDYLYSAETNFGGRIMWDPGQNYTLQEISTTLRLVHHEAYVAHDSVTEYWINGGSWGTRTPLQAATQKVLKDFGPLLERASMGAFSAILPWYAGYDEDRLVYALRLNVEYSQPQKERYDVYRDVRYGLHRQTRAPYDPLNDYPGTPIVTPDPVVVTLYDVPKDLIEAGWTTPGDVMRLGTVLDNQEFPASTGHGATAVFDMGLPVTTVPPNWSYGGYGNQYVWQDDAVATDVYNGERPSIGDKVFDFTYAAMDTPFKMGQFDFGAMMDYHFSDHGFINDGMHGDFTISAFYGFNASAQVYTTTMRVYEGTVRASKWAPSLEPLIYVPPPPSVIWGGPTTGETGEYIYEGDVGVGVAPPTLWFLYKKWAFLEDHVVAYGQGLGNTEGQLHGVLKIGPGGEYPIILDVRPGVAAWQLNAASNHAYDGTGVIYPGTAVAPPRVDAEVQTVEFVIPPTIDLPDPAEWHVYVTNDNGRSNALPLMLYPKVDIDMKSTDPLLTTTASAMGAYDPTTTVVGLGAVAEQDKLPQRYSLLPTPFTLTGPIPERPPQLLTSALGDFVFTGATQTTGLDDPVDITVPFAQRYRPIESQVVPRTDIGTGVSLWMPNGTNANAWKFYVDTAPYVDPTSAIPSRNGDIVRPAMVFPGNAYGELVNGLPVGPDFTIAMVTTIYPDPQPRTFLLSSFIQGQPDPDTFPLEVYVEGDMVTVAVGGRIFSTRIAPGYIGRRPVILMLSISQWTVRFGLVSSSAYVRDGSHSLQKSSGLRLYLGRCNDAGNLRVATMDVLDLAIQNNALSASDFTLAINRFDSAYGVMQ